MKILFDIIKNNNREYSFNIKIQEEVILNQKTLKQKLKLSIKLEVFL